MMKLIPLLFFITSCAGYVNQIHRQIDNEQRAKYQQQYTPRQQTRYNQNQPGDRRPINNPVTLNGQPTASTQANMLPSVQRNYGQSTGRKRYQASDLTDNGSDGSLWSGKNSESFLFVNNNLKKPGDIVIIEVQKDLKDTIQDELKRNFPDPVAKTGTSSPEGTAATPEAQAEAAPANPADVNSEKVYDKISAAVVEEVNQDYLLIRGRKEVLYKKYKRYFEIQAIVSQKDISSRDTIKSTKLLEPRINVLRY